MSSLKRKTIINSFWKSIGNIFLRFIVGFSSIVLAWFLVPKDYALIAMISVLIAFSSILIDSGLSQALIRKPKVYQTELNTVFYTNLGLSVILYLTFYILAPFISEFYNEKRLIDIIRVVSISIFFNALSVVPRTLLIRTLKFKNVTAITLSAAILSSALAILLAYLDYGVWALIFQILFNSIFLTLFYWIFGDWRPSFYFNFLYLKKLWVFSSFLLVDFLISVPFENLYFIVLPKYFAASVVGFYFFSQKISQIFIELAVNGVQVVTYPILSKIQKNNLYLKNSYSKIINLVTFLSSPLILFLGALSSLIFDIFLPKEWANASNYLLLMCIAGVFYPLHLLFRNIFNVKGRSDLNLYIGIIKKLIILIVFIYTLQFGVYEIIIGQIVCSIVCHIPNVYYSSKIIKYTIGEQVSDFLPNILLASLIASLIYYLQHSLSLIPIVELIILIILATLMYLICAYFLKFKAIQLLRSSLEVLFKEK